MTQAKAFCTLFTWRTEILLSYNISMTGQIFTILNNDVMLFKFKINLYVGNNKIVYAPDKPRYDVP